LLRAAQTVSSREGDAGANCAVPHWNEREGRANFRKEDFVSVPAIADCRLDSITQLKRVEVQSEIASGDFMDRAGAVFGCAAMENEESEQATEPGCPREMA